MKNRIAFLLPKKGQAFSVVEWQCTLMDHDSGISLDIAYHVREMTCILALGTQGK